MVELTTAFAEGVAQEFAFLGRLGFTQAPFVSSGRVQAVAYRSRAVSVELLFGPPEFEPEMVVSHLQQGSRLNSSDLISLGALSMPESSPHPERLSSEEKIRNHLRWLAGMLRAADARLLAGDPAFHAELANRVELTRAELRRNDDLRRVRAEARNAWRRKHYGDVIRCYESIAQQLSPLEEKRLAYALKQAKGP